MSESQTVPLKIDEKFKISKDDLVKIVSACQERTFAEEINELEKHNCIPNCLIQPKTQ